MTIDSPQRVAPRHWTAVALLLSLLCAGCATHESRRGDSVDVSNFPPEIRESYRVFAVRCSRCHTLARPLNARIHDPQHWIRYVNRMRLQPGSGIDAESAQVILRFLLYYHGQGHGQGEEKPTEPVAPPEPAPAPAPAPAVPAAPSSGAQAHPTNRQPRYGAIAPSGAADGRQS